MAQRYSRGRRTTRRKTTARRGYSGRRSIRRRNGGRSVSRGQTLRIVVEQSAPAPVQHSPATGAVVPVIPGKKARF